MNVLFTVIAAEWHEHPALVQGIRDTWANKDTFFLWGNDHRNLKPGDWVWHRKESYGAMIWKFLDFLTEYEGDYDYVMKTNTGAYVDVPALYSWLEDKPRTGFYAGAIGHYNDYPYNTVDMDYVSGAGTIISKDLVKLMTGSGRKHFGPEHIDDIAIGIFMQRYGVTPFLGQRETDINIPSYHYYLRSHDGKRYLDIENMHQLHKLHAR